MFDAVRFCSNMFDSDRKRDRFWSTQRSESFEIVQNRIYCTVVNFQSSIIVIGMMSNVVECSDSPRTYSSIVERWKNGIYRDAYSTYILHVENNYYCKRDFRSFWKKYIRVVIKASAFTVPEWPLRMAMLRPSLRLHSRMVSSDDALASTPFATTSNAVTYDVCPLSVFTHRPSLSVHNLIVLSSDALAFCRETKTINGITHWLA